MKEIVQDGEPVLGEIAKPVPEEMFGTEELSRLIKDMEEALDKELEGVALAAPQIGVPYRLFIVRVDRTLPPPAPNTEGQTLHTDSKGLTLKPAPTSEVGAPTKSVGEIAVYINPEIIKTSRKRADVDEGCLSVRGIYGTTKRHERVTIRARRPDGSSFERGGGGLMAQIFEHEIDHLNGTLFIEHAKNLFRIDHDHEPS
ncbi:MAG: peptide deformylase [Candidatus Paceibacterota bacterium]|jgi:peptide deformylase